MPTSTKPTSQELADARFKKFKRDFMFWENQFLFEVTMDQFLDAYAQWKRERSKELKVRVTTLLFELKRLNPGFTGEVRFDDP